MPALTIQLKHQTWQRGQTLGGGSFGKVYEATGADGIEAAMKMFPKKPAAIGELEFGSIPSHPNILPILDSGEYKNDYVLIMPRAEKSLYKHIEASKRNFTIDEAIPILLDIAEALASLHGKVVHRDLKPKNVLLYNGHWCLADFGIARYADVATATETNKRVWSAEYAAPEQWRFEHATSATDVYALGIMASELLQGRLPFPGPTRADFREQHLNQQPPPVTGVSSSIVSLVNECHYKSAPSRPTPANILKRLRDSQKPASPAAARLQAINQEIIARRSEQGAITSAKQSVQQQRNDLFKTAQQSFKPIISTLRERIIEAAPAVVVTGRLVEEMRLGNGRLIVEPVSSHHPMSPTRYGSFPFDVVAFSAISVRKPIDLYGYEGRSHALWFCDAHEAGAYRWFETVSLGRADMRYPVGW